MSIADTIKNIITGSSPEPTSSLEAAVAARQRELDAAQAELHKAERVSTEAGRLASAAAQAVDQAVADGLDDDAVDRATIAQVRTSKRAAHAAKLLAEPQAQVAVCERALGLAQLEVEKREASVATFMARLRPLEDWFSSAAVEAAHRAAEITKIHDEQKARFVRARQHAAVLGLDPDRLELVDPTYSGVKISLGRKIGAALRAAGISSVADWFRPAG
jgi:hypothetical protein